MKKEVLYKNAVFHSGISQTDVFNYMTVSDGIITGTYINEPSGRFSSVVDLQGRHIYPCLIDPHIHMLLTIAVMAKGFNICEITSDGVMPNTIKGVEKRLREYASSLPDNAVIACNNYILTAIDQRRMPTKDELDEWTGGRAAVIYNIDGHSTSLSSKMLKRIGIDPGKHNGILQGEENERAQGKLIDCISDSVGLKDLAKGIAVFQNTCAYYGISAVGALEGNGDSPKDLTTSLIARLARHFDINVRLYLQYTDLDRVKKFKKFMKNSRVGGCGDWEMDGATGSHSSAFRTPFLDTGKCSPCYYSQEYTDSLVKSAADNGYQIASHAIGELAVEQLLNSLDKIDNHRLNRIEHCEFHDDAAFERLKRCRYAVVMQPGYAWIDKRYLHTYTQYLPQEICDRLKFKSLYDAGICLCGSSDSPVQDIDPYLQMLGMTEFYNNSESITPFEAFTCYTKHAAMAIEEYNERGSLEKGKAADFFSSQTDLFSLSPAEIVNFRPEHTWLSGKLWKNKKGNLFEFFLMLLKKPKLI